MCGVHSIINSSSSAKLLEAPTLIAMILNFFHYLNSTHSVERGVNVWTTNWQGYIKTDKEEGELTSCERLQERRRQENENSALEAFWEKAARYWPVHVSTYLCVCSRTCTYLHVYICMYVFV